MVIVVDDLEVPSLPPMAAGCAASPRQPCARKSRRCNNGRRALRLSRENGARFELKDANRDGQIDSGGVEQQSAFADRGAPRGPAAILSSALTPRAIAAARTKWAVDVAEAKTPPCSSPMAVSSADPQVRWTRCRASDRAKASMSRRPVR